MSPVLRDGGLRFPKLHAPVFDERGQIIFDQILLFEADLQSLSAERPALWPEVVERVGAAQFQGNQVVQFASGSVLVDAIPLVGSCIGRLPDPFRTRQPLDLVTGPRAVEAVDFTPSAEQLSQEYFLAVAAAVSVRTETKMINANNPERAASLTFMLSFQVEFDEPD